MAETVLRSYEFRREREASWRDLEFLVDQVEKRGIRSLSADDLERLPILYRSALSSLSVARSISLDQNVVEYLEGLAGRAYFCVYGTRTRLLRSVIDFVRYRFPQSFRLYRWHILVSALMFIAGGFTAFFLTLQDPDLYYAFMDEGMAQGRNPAASTETLRAGLYDTEPASDTLVNFAAFLFTHNSKVGMMSFALGFLLGIPVFLLMFMNGLVLGAFTALYHMRGLSVDVWGWLLPHGVTELLAVIVCGGAGLVLAQSIILPGRRSRIRNLGLRGREAAVLVIGAVGMLFFAGLIEGIFRQTVTDVTVRYFVATSTALFWIVYFGFVGKRNPSDDSSTS